MKISRSTGYALLATCYIAKNQSDGIVLSQVIAKAHSIPLEYLLKILQQLVRANVLRSKRGPRGGFLLAKPAKKISMLDIIEAVDGPVVGKLDLSAQSNKEAFAAKAEQIYQKAIDQAKAVFAKTKLADLV
ncbi:MAG: Rrf2 family transcriptional regulator [Phycisphaerae bacterium]|nr:Rrf2 family transcriptional regulator [Phycisphaerae bacterium]